MAILATHLCPGVGSGAVLEQEFYCVYLAMLRRQDQRGPPLYKEGMCWST